MARAKGSGGGGGGGGRPAAKGPRDLQSASEQTHQITGFRLTGTSAIELVITAALYTMSLVFVLLAFTGWRYGSMIREAQISQTLHRLDQAPAASAAAAASYGSDLTVQMLRFCAAIDAGDVAAATEAADRMQSMAPGEPDTALARAVLLLTDPSTTALTASREEAEALLRDASALPEAQAALGQLALDRGDLDAADRAFRSVLESTDPLPSDVACAIAYNGRGLSRLQATRDLLVTPDQVLQSIDDFRRAMAYRLPWAAPMVNRDRAAAIWLRLRLREIDGDHGDHGDQGGAANPAAHRAAVEAVLAEFNTRLGFEAAERDVVNIEPRSYASNAQWPATKDLKVPVSDGMVPVPLGRIPAEPMTNNRRRYLLNVLAMAEVRLIDPAGTVSQMRARFNTVRKQFEEAGGSDGRFPAAAFNKVMAGLRMFRLASSHADRQVAMGGDLPKLLREFCDNPDTVPPGLRAPLLTAFYVVVGAVPDKFVDGRLTEGADMLALIERLKLLERIEQAGGPRAPTRDWLDFQRQHLAIVREALRPGATDEPTTTLEVALPYAERLAAWLPVETAPEPAAQLNDPRAIGKGPLLDRPCTWTEAGLLVRLYEQALRDLANALTVKVQSLPSGDDARRLDLLMLAKRTETCRIRLCGALAAEKSWCYGRVPEADHVLENAISLLRRVENEIAK